MVFKATIGFLLIFSLSCIAPTALLAAAPELSQVPAGCTKEATLRGERERLEWQMKDIMVSVKSNKARCSSVESGSKLEADCRQEGKRITQRYADLVGKYKAFNDSVEGARMIMGIGVLAKRLGWSVKEISRLEMALNELDVDGTAATDEQIRDTWVEVLARRKDESFALEASQGSGSGFPGAGEQTRYQDCAIFALANAAGLPYGVVAARATDLIRQGEWRKASERENPGKVIERSGLNGGEVVMLAEAFGQAEVIPVSDFARKLKEGRRVMVNVIPKGGNGGHEVVLTKVFQHGGGNWYEMMDSNQGPQQRLYISHKELNTILQEKGVAFLPDPGKTPKLLRSDGAQ